MTRFDATDPTERRKLFADAIAAHRNRDSPYVTFEAAPAVGDRDPEDGELSGTMADASEIGGGDADVADDDTLSPWIQFAEDDGLLNMDCTDDELDRLKSLLDEYPSFRIDELTRPETAEGTNVRVSARADAKRIADFVDDAFQRVYDREADYRAWAVEL